MWELDQKEGWAPKNWCVWTAVLEKTLKSPLDSKEIKPVNSKGNQPWIFIGRTDAKAPKLRPLDVKCWLTGKDRDTGKDRRQKKVALDETVGWHHGITNSVDIWANSQRQWRRGKPGMLQSTGLQKVEHSLANEQLYPLNNSAFSPPSSPWQPLFYSNSLTTLDTSLSGIM